MGFQVQSEKYKQCFVFLIQPINLFVDEDKSCGLMISLFLGAVEDFYVILRKKRIFSKLVPDYGISCVELCTIIIKYKEVIMNLFALLLTYLFFLIPSSWLLSLLL